MIATQRRRGVKVGLALSLGTLVLGSIAAWAQTRRSLIAAGDSPGLFLIQTGDVIGYLEPCG